MSDETHLHAGEAARVPDAGTSTGAKTGPGYEVRDTNVRGILTFVVGLFVALTITQFAMWGLLHAISGGAAKEPAPTSPYAEAPDAPGFVPPVGKVTPEVAMEITEQRRRLDAEEKATLAGRVGPDHNTKGGPAVIPIDRAIDLIAGRGLPARNRPGRTEVEVNSHSGKPAPAGGADGKPDTKDARKADRPDVPESRTKN